MRKIRGSKDGAAMPRRHGRPRPGRKESGLGLLAGLAGLLLAGPAIAQAVQSGPVTGLPVPRYVSLKADRVNLREGPSKDHRTSWVYQRAGLPVEVTGEFETWRRIRDSEGAEGWVLHSLLSGRRTALVMPWSRNRDELLIMHARPEDGSQVAARIQPGVLVNVRSCAEAWCRVMAGDTAGFIRQDRLWGVYPNEDVD